MLMATVFSASLTKHLMEDSVKTAPNTAIDALATKLLNLEQETQHSALSALQASSSAEELALAHLVNLSPMADALTTSFALGVSLPRQITRVPLARLSAAAAPL